MAGRILLERRLDHEFLRKAFVLYPISGYVQECCLSNLVRAISTAPAPNKASRGMSTASLGWAGSSETIRWISSSAYVTFEIRPFMGLVRANEGIGQRSLDQYRLAPENRPCVIN